MSLPQTLLLLDADALADWWEPFQYAVDTQAGLLTVRCEHVGRWLVQLWPFVGCGIAVWISEPFKTGDEAIYVAQRIGAVLGKRSLLPPLSTTALGKKIAGQSEVTDHG